MNFDYSQAKEIPMLKMVKVKQMKHLVEVVSVKNDKNGFNNIQKLNKLEYMHKDTGEVFNYKISENRAQDESSLKDTFRKIRDLINKNFVGSANEVHLTLTYKENMVDAKKLYSDFEKFWKKVKYAYGEDMDYMTVVEPQGRGAWHCHVLIRHNGLDKLFMPSNEVEKLWGHGFVKLKSLKDVDNIGAYLSAYLGDVELTPKTIYDVGINNILEVKEVLVDGKKKKFIKGGRLHMYPSGMNLYRHSKGIVPPDIVEMLYQDIKKIVGCLRPNYSQTLTITDDLPFQKAILNQVTYEYYNTKRKFD